MTESPSAADIESLLNGETSYRWSDRALLRIQGEDALPWLSGQITQDLKEATADRAIYATIVNLQGMILTDLWVLKHDEETFDLLVPRAQVEELRAYLDGFIIMEDVDLIADTEGGAVVQFGDQEPTIEAPFDAAWSAPIMGRPARLVRYANRAELDAWAEGSAHAVIDSSIAWAIAHLKSGTPLYGVDFGSKMLPQEAGVKHTAVSFNKGCYQGQEAIVMMEHRGKPRKRLVDLELAADEDSPEVSAMTGAEIQDAAGKTCGAITMAHLDPSSGTLLLRGWLRRRALEDEERVLQAQGKALTLVRLLGEAPGDTD